MLDDLRDAIGRGLQVDNAWAIVRLCHDLLRDGDVDNPVVVLVVQAVVKCRAEVQDGVAMDAGVADRIDALLIPALLDVIDASRGRQLGLLTALNSVAKAHAETLKAATS